MHKYTTNLAKYYRNPAKTHFKNCNFDITIEDYTKAIELNIQDADVYHTRK